MIHDAKLMIAHFFLVVLVVLVVFSIIYLIALWKFPEQKDYRWQNDLKLNSFGAAFNILLITAFLWACHLIHVTAPMFFPAAFN